MDLNACMSTKFGEYEGMGASKHMSIFRGSRRKARKSVKKHVFAVVL